MRDNAIQLKQRKGEYYERWLKGMEKFYERLERGIKEGVEHERQAKN